MALLVNQIPWLKTVKLTHRIHFEISVHLHYTIVFSRTEIKHTLQWNNSSVLFMSCQNGHLGYKVITFPPALIQTFPAVKFSDIVRFQFCFRPLDKCRTDLQRSFKRHPRVRRIIFSLQRISILEYGVTI